jgi:hypothetical protein
MRKINARASGTFIEKTFYFMDIEKEIMATLWNAVLNVH